MRYFNPATNALVTADPSVGTFHNDITVETVVYQCLARNNYQVPVNLRIYACVPRHDTQISTKSYFDAGLLDQGNPSGTSPLVYPSDSQILMEQWKFVKSVKKVLNPGQSCEVSYAIKRFEYDFSQADHHNDPYQTKYNGFNWLFRLEGVLGHDTSVDEQGTLPSGS